MNYTFTRIIAFLAIVLLPSLAFSQCMIYPVSLDERVNSSSSILLGRVADQHCYADAKGNIYTSNKIEVRAWLKGNTSTSVVHVITLGGILNNKAQVTYPAVQLEKGREYFLMLQTDDKAADDKSLRSTQPNIIQAQPFADAQGAWMYADGKYHDVFNAPVTETELLQLMQSKYKLQVNTPAGSAYMARSGVAARGSQTQNITSFSPNPTNAGTINPADYLTINGSGFGAVRGTGTVEFPNADNGGSSYITPPNESDYVQWTDNQIIVKVPTGVHPTTNAGTNAGTGFFRVITDFGLQFTSPSQLVIGYSHISINEQFSGFTTSTRQRYYLRNMNTLGGYTFRYNTNFSSNAGAVAAFERALTTWTCNTGINWVTAGSTTAFYDNDNVNVVLFDNTLGPGTLARATSRFNGSAITGTCDLQNTMWWLEEIDVQANPNVNWQYGPANAVIGQYDFETVLLHELGHAHGLGHRIATGQLMNFSIGSGVNIRTPAPVEIQGGLAKMSYSTQPTCFNPGTGGTPMIAASCPLPLQLMSFTGVLKPIGTELNWTTQNELNVDRFEVQRSTNGTDFAAIGSVKAKNSSGENKYQFLDAKPQQGINYYRLKMIDKDGSYNYSAVVTIKFTEAVKPFYVYPNPVRSELQVSASIKTTLNLVDASGKLVRKLQVEPGNNKINAANLSNGVYYLLDPSTGDRIRLLIMH
jgi:hypothetical protein